MLSDFVEKKVNIFHLKLSISKLTTLKNLAGIILHFETFSSIQAKKYIEF